VSKTEGIVSAKVLFVHEHESERNEESIASSDHFSTVDEAKDWCRAWIRAEYYPPITLSTSGNGWDTVREAEKRQDCHICDKPFVCGGESIDDNMNKCGNCRKFFCDECREAHGRALCSRCAKELEESPA